MRSIKTASLIFLCFIFASNAVFAWGSHPDETNTKLNTMIEKDQEDAANKALDSITEQIQDANNSKAGGKQS